MKNKKGKKLVVLGAMAALLTLIGVSGSQTYAKYVESTTVPSQTATVAKWGFAMTGNTTNLFASAHEKEVLNGSTKAHGGQIIVAGASDAIVVAPGTSGYVDFSISGTAEVASKLSFTLSHDSEIKLSDGSSVEYLPLKWTLEESTNGGTSFAVLKNADNLTDLAGLMSTFTTTIGPNQTYSKIYRIGYSWAFHVDDLTDTYDTVLAEKAVNSTLTGEYAAYSSWTAVTTVKFTVVMDLQQVQLP